MSQNRSRPLENRERPFAATRQNLFYITNTRAFHLLFTSSCGLLSLQSEGPHSGCEISRAETAGQDRFRVVVSALFEGSPG